MKTMACSFLTMVRTTLITLTFISYIFAVYQPLCSAIIPLCFHVCECACVCECGYIQYTHMIHLHSIVCTIHAVQPLLCPLCGGSVSGTKSFAL